MTNLSGTITAGNSAQTIAAFNPARRYLSIRNASADKDLWVRFGGTAAAASPSILIEPGGYAEWGSDARELICRAISVFGDTTSEPFTAFEATA
jgi:hypothetical protein